MEILFLLMLLPTPVLAFLLLLTLILVGAFCLAWVAASISIIWRLVGFMTLELRLKRFPQDREPVSSRF